MFDVSDFNGILRGGSVTDIMTKTKRVLTENQISLISEATLNGLRSS